MSYEFIICLILLFSLSAIGTPIAYAIFVSSCAYLWVGGQGIGLAGKVILDGLYSSFILLAVPLFIVAANIMNAGTISDRLLSFCVAVVGRFKGGLGHVNVVASTIFSGMSGSAVADAAGIGKGDYRGYFIPKKKNKTIPKRVQIKARVSQEPNNTITQQPNKADLQQKD